MKTRILILLLILSENFQGSAQNLVLNDSFEDTISCVTWNALGGPPLLVCSPWYQAVNSPDNYLNNLSYCGINNPFPLSFGYQQPVSGNAIVGFGTFVKSMLNSREIVGGKLVDSLKVGHLYAVSFYVSAANDCKYFTDKIGAYFSVDSISQDSDFTFQYIPQIENSSGNILNDTLNWVLISGSFTALGGEKYISIGNFRDDNQTTIDSTSNATGSIYGAYYYIDDVSVIDCSATGIHEQQQIVFTLLQNPVSNSVCFTAPVQLQKAIIFNTVGGVFKEQVFEVTTAYQIDVADLPKGIYFLQVETKDKSRGIRKFVKQ